MLNEQLKNYSVILASQSPRRKQLLKQLDIEFQVEVRSIQEDFPNHLGGPQIAEYLALQKAAAFPQQELTNELIITADTIVVIGNEVLNKPENQVDAKRMLTLLSGAEHTVYTGVCITTAQKQHVFSVGTKVRFQSLSEAEINYYLNNYQPYDKAGAYGIQEWIGSVAIAHIEGEYNNVVGFPTSAFYKELNQFLA